MARKKAKPVKKRPASLSPSTGNKAKKKKMDEMNEKPTNLPRLPTELLLKIMSNLNQEDLGRISQVSHRFRDLCKDNSLWTHISLPNSLDNQQAVELVKKWSKLKSLHIEERSDSVQLGALALTHCPQLEVLELENCNPNNSLREAFAKYGVGSLRKLNLVCDGISGLSKLGPQNLNKLTDIRLHGREYKEDVMSIMKHCRNLSSFYMSLQQTLPDSFLGDENQRIITQFLVGNAATLKSLGFGLTALSNATLMQLSQCGLLENLEVHDIMHMSSGALRSVLQLTQLKSLKLSTYFIMFEAWNGLTLTGLIMLDLQVEFIFNNSALEAITSGCINLVDFRLKCIISDCSAVTYRSILQNCKELKHLELDIQAGNFQPTELFHGNGSGGNLTCLKLTTRNSINDRFLEQILANRCPKLEVLMLNAHGCTGFTENSVRRLLLDISPNFKLLEMNIRGFRVLKVERGESIWFHPSSVPAGTDELSMSCEHTKITCFCYGR